VADGGVDVLVVEGDSSDGAEDVDDGGRVGGINNG
jgi:hypothetical protein